MIHRSPFRMLLPRFELEAPTSVALAAARLAEAGAEARLLAGGTDLLVKMKRGELRPRLLLSLGRVPGLGGLEAGPAGGLRVGPLCTMSRLESSPLLAAPFAALAEGAAVVGGPVVRNRATVGGNIVNARPCADTVPPLVVLGARLELTSRAGARRVELDGFITGPGATGIRPDEILTAIEVPAPGGPSGSSYLKITRRAAMEVTLVGCAASVVLEPDADRVAAARVVLASVAPVPLRVPEAEAVLVGQTPDEARLRAAAEAARTAARPIDDHRAPADYRREVVEVITRRALALALERARRQR